MTKCHVGVSRPVSDAEGTQSRMVASCGARHRLAVCLVVAAAALSAAEGALACVCANEPIEKRLDAADAALVGRVVAHRDTEAAGAPQRLLTVEVAQRVKGDLPRELQVRSPLRTDCDVLPPGRSNVGLLLTRLPDGAWYATACSVVDPGSLVAAGGEPRGGPIKVAVGLVLLALVLFWSFRRLRRGARPDLPSAPGP